MFTLTQDEYDFLKMNAGGVCCNCRETHIFCDYYCEECKMNAVRSLSELEEDGLIRVIPE